MNKKRLMTCILALMLMIGIPAHVQACTIFMAETENGPLVGNNEDWYYSFPSSVRIIAPEERSYGRICFYMRTYIQGGMNEHGLFFDCAVVPQTELPFDDSKKTLGYDFGEVALSTCANVAEAVELFETYNFPAGIYIHILFADAAGESVVLEWAEGELRILYREDAAYQLITNYLLTNKSLGGYPCHRFTTAEKLLEENTPSIPLFQEILNATKQNWGSGGTLYSNIYDLSNRDAYIFHRGRMEAACKINLTQRLASMEAGQTESYSIEALTFDIAFTDAGIGSGPDIDTNAAGAALSADQIAAEGTRAAGEQESAPAPAAESEEKSNFRWRGYLIIVMAAALAVSFLFVYKKRHQK